MRKLSKALSLVLAVALSSSSLCINAFAETFVAIDMDSTYQTIDGFGASYTWYSDWLVNNENAETAYDWIFNDAEFNILRFRDLNHVGDEYQSALDGYETYYAFYSAALERGIEPIVLVTSWGQYDRDLDFVAFTELDDNGYTYYTLAKNENGEYIYDELAQFCVESVQLFFDAGIPVDYFSISNETELQGLQIDENGNARDEAGFYFGADEDEYHCAYWKAHLAVYEAFQEAFGEYAPSITGAEVMADTASRLEAYISPLIENGGADTFEVIAHHLYGSDNTKSSYFAVADLYYGDYTLWQTEWYYNEYINHAEKMANEFIYEGISAYLYWNGVWIADTGNCLIEIDSSSENASISRNGNHYIMMHFSKYVKNGYKRVDVGNDSGSTIVAFKAPDDSRLVIIVVNNTDDDDEITFDLGDATVIDSFGYQTIGNENRFKYSYWNEVSYSEVRNYIPAQSVTTFVIDMPANPDYVEVTVEKEANPFVKTPSSNDIDVWSIVVIACGIVAVVVIAIVLIVPTKKKKSSTEDTNTQE
ncbi:MAG: hypothetical protein LUG23_06120 [Oscillospiraceae bacterium]|nr:hypothetical protein [Oscillospiraceae bacterium]